MIKNIKFLGLMVAASCLLSFSQADAGYKNRFYVQTGLSDPQNATVTRDASGSFILSFSVTDNASGAVYNFSGPLTAEYSDDSQGEPDAAQLTLPKTR